MDKLTQREEEVLQLIVSGRSTKQIAGDLGISFKTAACHRYRVMQKSAASNAADLVRKTLATPRGADNDLEEMISSATMWCDGNDESRLLLAPEIAKAKQLRQECQEMAERLRFLLTTLAMQPGTCQAYACAHGAA
jgi:DNA-binding CsgD family transcriptional regulator